MNTSSWRGWLAVCIGFVVLGCGETSGDTEKTAGYFDLETLVRQQIVLLEEERPEVEKRVRLNEEEETLITREVNWNDDLAFFLDADISKPSLADSYVLEKPDSSTEVYHLKPGESLPVHELIVVYDTLTAEVAQVRVKSVAESMLFDTVRNLKLVLSGKKGANRVVSYEIVGFQQLKLGEKKHFEILGQLRQPAEGAL